MYALTISLSAFLLFLVQPLISKMLLPSFGGGASIWVTSLVFFQVVLLAGYAITHLLVRRLGLRRHVFVTAGLLILSTAWLPIGPDALLALDTPAIHLFVLLTLSVGVPYLMLATTSPTLQYWIANDDRRRGRSPYVQYGVSNVGSLAGLLAYPLLLEPYMTNTTQTWFWTMLYLTYALLMAGTMFVFVKHNHLHVPNERGESLSITRKFRLRWVFQAMVPSALLLVITHYLTLDVVNFPLLWVAPLCLYLLTFILCFLFPRVSVPDDARTLIGVASILFLLIANYDPPGASWELKVAAALTCMFCVAMIFHGDLERDKPHKQDLTDFYLHLSIGGTLGGIFGAVIAPLVFVSTFEFYVVLVVALYYMIVSRFSLRPSGRWLFNGGVAASLLMSWLVHELGMFGGTLYQTRTFYSTYAVRESGGQYPIRKLIAGTHVHGQQFYEEPLEHEPIAYYHKGAGVGDLFMVMNPSRVAVVGLGIGSVVEYGGASDRFDIFELDPVVVDIANRYFSVLPESHARLRYYLGDGRIRMRQMPNRTYDLVVMDSFSSGSIPAHLMTVEAVEEMLARTKAGGAIAYHISNRHVDLLPVLNGIAEELEAGILYHRTTGGGPAMKGLPATWVALSNNRTLLETLERRDGWHVPPERGIIWTDEFSNLWTVLH